MSNFPPDPFPHPENRQWHPMAISFSQLLLLVISDHPNQSKNHWKDDVIYYLLWWEKKANKDSEYHDKNSTISLNNLIIGLKSLTNTLESKK